MKPFDYANSVAEFWTAQAQACEQTVKVLAERMKAASAGKFPMLPANILPGATDAANATKSVMEFWSAAMSVYARLAIASPVTAGGEGPVEATFRKMADPRPAVGGMREIDNMLARMAERPRFADLWEAERRYTGVLQGWLNLRRCGLEHSAVLLEALAQAGRRFVEQLARTGGDGKALDATGVLTLWTETANQQLLETQRSVRFLQTREAMIDATTELRMARQQLVEHLGKPYGSSTRKELDDLNRTVTELRREVSAIRRELDKPAAVIPIAVAAEPLRVQQPVRRGSAKPKGTKK